MEHLFLAIKKDQTDLMQSGNQIEEFFFQELKEKHGTHMQGTEKTTELF